MTVHARQSIIYGSTAQYGGSPYTHANALGVAPVTNCPAPPQGNKAIALVNNNGIYFTDDISLASPTWTAMNTDLELHIVDFNALPNGSGGLEVWAWDDHNLYYTPDIETTTWTLMHTLVDAGGSPAEYYTKFWYVVPDPDGTYLYAFILDHFLGTGGDYDACHVTVKYSSNNGSTFSSGYQWTFPTNYSPDARRPHAVVHNDYLLFAYHIWCSGQQNYTYTWKLSSNGITLDASQTFTYASNVNNWSRRHQFISTDANPYLAIATVPGMSATTIYWSTDNGANWTDIVSPTSYIGGNHIQFYAIALDNNLNQIILDTVKSRTTNGWASTTNHTINGGIIYCITPTAASDETFLIGGTNMSNETAVAITTDLGDTTTDKTGTGLPIGGGAAVYKLHLF